jgi:hypothetical protein
VGGGLGFIAIQNLRLLKYGRSMELFLYMILMGFSIDVIVGLIQFVYMGKMKSTVSIEKP